MDAEKTFQKVRTLESLRDLGEEKLKELSRLLEPVQVAAGQAVIEEGAAGDCLYFIADGKVRIEKRIPAEKGEPEKSKELATLGGGDFFGEMALVEEQARSARVVAVTECALFRLDRDDLFAWLENQPQRTIAFFLTLMRTLSHRLRATSRELTFLYDLASLFLEENSSERVLLMRVVQNLDHILEGHWSVAGYLYNEFNEEYELVSVEGPEMEALKGRPVPATGKVSPGWQDLKNLWAALPGAARPAGFLLVVSQQNVGPREREEVARIVQTVARLLVSAILNIRHRTEEALKARLKSQVI